MNELLEYEYQEQLKARDVELAGRDAQIRHLLSLKETLEKQLDFKAAPYKVPKWLAPKRKRRSDEHSGIACTMLSDDHFDEVVDPAEMSGNNAYNREIGTLRLRAFFDNTVKITHHYWSGVRYEGMTLIGGGDFGGGGIHGELERTNDGKSQYEGLLYWAPLIAAGIEMWADVYGRVFIPWTVGNHGRWRQGKWQHKRRVVDNLDWLLGKWLETHFANDERVTFLIPEDPDVPFQVYDVRFLLTHGQTGGGSGIGGIFPPIFRLLAGLHKRWEFDVGVLGHWHQDVFTPEQGLIINGAMKGYDEFARDCRFRPERPSQSLWLVTPEHGITEHAPIIVSDRKAEGW